MDISNNHCFVKMEVSGWHIRIVKFQTDVDVVENVNFRLTLLNKM
jgi:hypothetical protein